MSGSQSVNYDAILGQLTGASRALRNAAEGLTLNVKRSNKGDAERAKAAATLSRGFSSAKDNLRRFESTINNTTRNISEMSESAERFGDVVNSLIQRVFLGAVAMQAVNGLRGLTETYQKLNDIGQTFGGSMFEMSRQAGEAGLSLGMFAQMLEKNSAASAALSRQGAGGLPGLTLEVRKSIREFGNYGFTLEEVAGLTSDYAETMRLQNQLEVLDRDQQRMLISGLASDISAFAKVTGKSRRDMLQATNDALREVALTARLAQGASASQQRAVNEATAFFASIPGDVGRQMASFFTQSFGRGNATFTDMADTFVQAGMGAIIPMMEQLVARVQQGTATSADLMAFARNFVNLSDSMSESLMVQDAARNQSATAVLSLTQQMRALANQSEDAIERAREENSQRERLTNFFTSFNDVMNQLLGAFRKGFMGAITNVTSRLRELSSDEGIRRFAERFEAAGETLGRIITTVLTEDNIERFATWLNEAILGLEKFIIDITNPDSLLRRSIREFYDGVTEGLTGFVNSVAWLSRQIRWIGSLFGFGEDQEQRQQQQSQPAERGLWDRFVSGFSTFTTYVVAAGVAFYALNKVLFGLPAALMRGAWWLTRGLGALLVSGAASIGIAGAAGAAGAVGAAGAGAAAAAGAGAAAAAAGANRGGTQTPSPAQPGATPQPGQQPQAQPAQATPQNQSPNRRQRMRIGARGGGLLALGGLGAGYLFDGLTGGGWNPFAGITGEGVAGTVGGLVGGIGGGALGSLASPAGTIAGGLAGGAAGDAAGRALYNRLFGTNTPAPATPAPTGEPPQEEQRADEAREIAEEQEERDEEMIDHFGEMVEALKRIEGVLERHFQLTVLIGNRQLEAMQRQGAALEDWSR